MLQTEMVDLWQKILMRKTMTERSKMETNKKVIEDLKGLVNIVNDGKEGYLSASDTTESVELRDLFLRLASQRVGYANELKNHVKVLAFMEHQARKGTDPDLKAFASKTVPVISSHLNAIRKIKGGLK